jgi:CRISPR-associated exonuclease Cas4
LIKTEREFIPVDYKFGLSHHGRVHLNHKYQVAAYALLVEENFSTIVRRAYVFYSRDRALARIDFSDEVRRRTLKMVREVRQIIEEEIEPASTRNPGRCTDCEYRRYCEGALI